MTGTEKFTSKQKEAFSFHPSQGSIAADTHRYRVVNCGRRFGKTKLAVWEMLGCALAEKDRRIAYLAPTYQQARDIAWLELKQITAPVAKAVNESRLEIEVKTTDGGTSFIVLRGWESVETLRGQKFHMLVIDEIAQMRSFWEGWQEVLRPALTDYRGSVLFLSTPKGFNHFYDLYRMEAKDADFKSFHFTSYDNPYMPREELDKARLELTEDRFAQEYLADFRKTEGLVYKEFDRARHVISETQLPPHFAEIIAGVDFGFTHPAAVMFIGKDHDSRYFLFQEFYKRGKTDAEIAEFVAAQKFHRVYPDPENPAAIEELRRRNVNVREVKKGKDSVRNGINVVRELLKSNRLYIVNSCENTILEFETYSYPDGKNGKDSDENPLKEGDDAMDALRYPLMMDSPLSTRRVAELTMPNQKHYGDDGYATFFEGKGYRAHRYEQ
jgi:PBSX family phage terminase large subunit